MDQSSSDNSWYLVIAFIVGVLAFLGIWLYALTEWGLLLGLVFGWIPAAIGGTILGFIWPIPVLIILYSFR